MTTEIRPDLKRFEQLGVDAEVLQTLNALGKAWAGEFDYLADAFHPNLRDFTKWESASEGIEGIRTKIETIRKTFPDLHEEVEEVIQRGNTVAVRVLISGTHRGAYGALAPTGKFVKWRVNAFYELVDNRIVREWSIAEEASLLSQLGFQIGGPTLADKV
jgi:predicted ester cyclase